MNEFESTNRFAPHFLNWVKSECLPFWGSAGVDWAGGGFHERLDLAGKPINVPKRLMVQARQLYVCCCAGLSGWYDPARALAERSLEYMVNSYFEGDGRPGWVFSLSPDGHVADKARDTYAHAFVLLGLAWYNRITPDSQIMGIVDRTIQFMEESLASQNGGFYDCSPVTGTLRRQNPHMHLFEAFLALYESFGEPKYLTRATEIFQLFKTAFFRREGGYLCEYLTDILEPAEGKQGRLCEPGHHYEWVWLLRRYETVSGEDADYYCRSLYDHANRYGWDENGFIVDELDGGGDVVKGGRRIWPQTEGLKANLVEAFLGRHGADRHVAQCISNLMKHYLGRPVAGGWIDHLDANQRPLVNFMPASTLYHIICAAAEAEHMINVRQG
jgi:mannose/cellobiose epimerase-like protein (N-acyl-D-glucosamine 2-epimerase family)